MQLGTQTLISAIRLLWRRMRTPRPIDHVRALNGSARTAEKADFSSIEENIDCLVAAMLRSHNRAVRRILQPPEPGPPLHADGAILLRTRDHLRWIMRNVENQLCAYDAFDIPLTNHCIALKSAANTIMSTVDPSVRIPGLYFPDEAYSDEQQVSIYFGVAELQLRLEEVNRQVRNVVRCASVLKQCDD